MKKLINKLLNKKEPAVIVKEKYRPTLEVYGLENKRIVIFNVPVGNMSRESASRYMGSIKDTWSEIISDDEDNIDVIFMPRRDEE